MVEQLVDLRRAGRADRVIAVGMDSTELGVDHRGFEAAFAAAKRGGLRRTGHAGEAVGVGSENIRLAIDELGVERIDHGIAVVEDPALMEQLASERVPITVCPNSNIVIANRYPSLAEHPFQRMREAGLLVTLNTDDPALTDLDLGKEYQTVAQALGLSVGEMARICVEGIDSTFLDESERSRLRSSFTVELEALSPELA
jgi:adenine deaminase